MDNLTLEDWISSLKKELDSNLTEKSNHYNFDFRADAPKPVPKPKFLWAELPVKACSQNSSSSLFPMK